MRVSPIFVVICIDNPTQKTPWQARSCRVPLAFYALMGYDALQMIKPRIYVDADACPVKDEIYRVAERHGLPVSVVAGNFIRVPQDPLIERVAAGSGMDAADDWIAERVGKGDIVITSDIPLASRCVKAGAEVIAPNGKPFTEQSIGMTLAVRNLMTDLRSSGEGSGGPRSFAPRDRSAFLSALDQTIRRIQRQRAEQSAQNQN